MRCFYTGRESDMTFEAIRDTSEEAQKFWVHYLQEWEAYLTSLDKRPNMLRRGASIK